MIPMGRLQILCLAVLLLCAACAGVQTKADPESSSEAALWKRADTYWQNRIRLRLGKTYPFETPAYRKRFPLAHYARTYPGEIMYHKATIKSIKIDGDSALVDVEIRYSFIGAFSPKGGVQTTLGSHWTLVDGEWYHLIGGPANKNKR